MPTQNLPLNEITNREHDSSSNAKKVKIVSAEDGTFKIYIYDETISDWRELRVSDLGSSSGGYEIVGLKDSDDNRINPSEKERQEEFIKLIDELIKRIPINDSFHYPVDVKNKVDSKVTHIKDKKFSYNYDEALWNKINAEIQNINISNLTFT